MFRILPGENPGSVEILHPFLFWVPNYVGRQQKRSGCSVFSRMQQNHFFEPSGETYHLPDNCSGSLGQFLPKEQDFALCRFPAYAKMINGT
jgi:hypothetical protein